MCGPGALSRCLLPLCSSRYRSVEPPETAALGGFWQTTASSARARSLRERLCETQHGARRIEAMVALALWPVYEPPRFSHSSLVVPPVRVQQGFVWTFLH